MSGDGRIRRISSSRRAASTREFTCSQNSVIVWEPKVWDTGVAIFASDLRLTGGAACHSGAGNPWRQCTGSQTKIILQVTENVGAEWGRSTVFVNRKGAPRRPLDSRRDGGATVWLRGLRRRVGLSTMRSVLA